MVCDPRDFPQCHPQDFPGYHPDPLDCSRKIRDCYTASFGPVQFQIAGGGAALTSRGFTEFEALAKTFAVPWARDLFIAILAAQPKHSGFLGLGVSTGTLGIIGQVVSGGAQLLGALLAPEFVIPSTVAQQAAYQTQRSQQAMGFDLGALIGGISTIATGLGGNIGNPYLQAVGQIGSSFSTAVARPTATGVPAPIYAAGPVYGQPGYGVVAPSYPVVRTQAGAIVGGASQMIRSIAAPILAKIAATLGRNSITLASAISVIKRAAKFLTSPEAIALALGLTVAELGTLITLHASKKHRRMNPANVRALRRSMRRLRSFDRLAARVSSRLAGRTYSRSRRRTRPCRVCRASPCTC